MDGKDPEPLSISEEDVRRIVRMVSEASVPTIPIEEKKSRLMTELSELVEADGWIWTLTQVDPVRKAPTSLGFLHGGLSEHQVTGWVEMNHRLTQQPPDHPHFIRLLQSGKHFTRGRNQLVDGEEWYAHPTVRQFRLDRGIDHSMHSIFPVDRNLFSGVGFYRFCGRPAFSDYERRLAHIVVAEVDWLHAVEYPFSERKGLHSLTSRQRMVMVFLLQGLSRREIADQLHISPHTVRDHVRAVYRALGVSSQSELIRTLRIGDGGDE